MLLGLGIIVISIIGILVFAFLVALLIDFIPELFKDKEDRMYSFDKEGAHILGLIIIFACCVFIDAAWISQANTAETVATYNEYEYDIAGIVAKLQSTDSNRCKLKARTDDSGMAYVRVDKYEYDSSLVVYVYNFDLDKDYFDYYVSEFKKEE